MLAHGEGIVGTLEDADKRILKKPGGRTKLCLGWFGTADSQAGTHVALVACTSKYPAEASIGLAALAPSS